MKKVLILEDKEIHRKALVKLLEGMEKELLIYEAATVAEAYPIAMENTINLFLIDIILDMETRGDVSGLKFVESIRKIPQYSFTPIIFITSLEDPAMYAYRDLHCYGYIEKPFSEKEVQFRINQALQYHQEENSSESVYFRNDGVIYSLKKDEIIFIEICRKNIAIHMVKETMTLPYMTCKRILQELNSNSFVQCNRGCIINKKYVKYIDAVNRYIKLAGCDDDVEIGKTMKERVLNEFRN